MQPGRGRAARGDPRGPERVRPGRAPAGTRRSAATSCCGLLYSQGYLTQSQYENSLVYPMPKPDEVYAALDAGRRGAVLRELRQGSARATASGRRRTFGGGLQVTTTLDVGLQQIARDAIKSVLPPNDTGPTASIVVLDAHIGRRASRWSAARTTTRTSSTSRRRASGSRARRSSRSCSRPRSRTTSRRRPCSTRTPVTINADGRLWEVNNYEGEYLGPINLNQAIAYSDNSVFSQLTAIVGPRNVRDTATQLGITTPLNGYFAIGLGAEPATPLEMARAYACVRRRRQAHRRLDLRATSRGSISEIKVDGKTQANSVVAQAGADRVAGGDRQRAAPGRRPLRHRQGGAAARPPGRRQDRHDRELRRRVVRRLHAAVRRRRLGRLPRQARPDDDRVPRPPGRRRHVPGADLEGVHEEGARPSSTCRQSRSRRPTTATRRP